MKLTYRILYVVNKRLPENDHRINYVYSSKISQGIFAMPGKPANIDKEDYVHMGFGEGIKISYLWQFFVLIIYLLKNRRYIDLVHFYSTLLILVGPLVAKLLGLSSIITITGFGRIFSNSKFYYRLLRPLYYVLFAVSLQLVHRALFQNQTDRDMIIRKFPKFAWKCRYVGSAVVAVPIKQKNFKTRVLRILLVARLLPDKGIDDFLEVARSLNSMDYEFVLVGPSSIGYKSLLQKVQRYADKKMITYLGELDSCATEEQFKQAHIIYFPSYGEGLSRVMLEAGYARVCPIAYDISANRDLISNGRGFLIPVGNVEKVIQTLIMLSENRDLLEENAKQFQQFIVENYNVEIFNERMDKILSEIFELEYAEGFMPKSNYNFRVMGVSCKRKSHLED